MGAAGRAWEGRGTRKRGRFSREQAHKDGEEKKQPANETRMQANENGEWPQESKTRKKGTGGITDGLVDLWRQVAVLGGLLLTAK